MAYPIYHWRHRLVSLRLDPKRHPFPEDSRWELVKCILVGGQQSLQARYPRRLLLWVAGLLLGYLPQPLLKLTYPHFFRLARQLSLFRGARSAFRRFAKSDLGPGMKWREAFQVAVAASGRPGIAAGDAMPHSASTVGAISRTLPSPLPPGE